jgi:hypothetical protein
MSNNDSIHLLESCNLLAPLDLSEQRGGDAVRQTDRDDQAGTRTSLRRTAMPAIFAKRRTACALGRLPMTLCKTAGGAIGLSGSAMSVSADGTSCFAPSSSIGSSTHFQN